MAPVRHFPWLLLVAVSAFAEEGRPSADAVENEVEEARANIASQLQLHAYDLLDELVFQWQQNPPFQNDTDAVLADISIPVDFGSGLQALLENHFVNLLLKNPKSHLRLVHCPTCLAMTVHSGKKGTVVGRGVDLPEALQQAGQASQSRHALFLDFEAEGSALVLRVRITSLEPKLPIVYAHTISNTTRSAALLRSPEHLKSAAEARKEYVDLLTGKGLLLVPITIGVRTYKASNFALVSAAPLIWLQLGIEGALSQARAWTASFSAGFTWLPESHVGWSLQARIARLLTGSTVSLSHPDLYLFVGGGLIALYGRGSIPFRNVLPTPDVLMEATDLRPNTTFGTIQAGLTLRLKNRIGASLYTEWSPGLDSSQALTSVIDLGPFRVHAIGVEVQFCF